MSIFNIGQKFDTISSKEMDLLEAAKSGNRKEAERILSSRNRKGSGGALSAIARCVVLLLESDLLDLVL